MNDGSTGYPWSTGDVLLAADLNAAIANAGAIIAGTYAKVFSVDFYGAKGDRRQYSGTLTVAAGPNPTLMIAGANLGAVVPGQVVVLPLGGAGGAGVKATVGSVSASQIVLNGSVATALTGIAYQASGNPVIATPGTGVTPLDVYTLVGGVSVVAAQVTVQSTTVVSVAINTPGSGGVNGTYTFIGTSPAATPFRFTGTITGGVLTSVVAVPTTGGSYQKNPPNLQAEPIVDVNGVSGLTGATVILSMGANSTQIQSQPSSIATVTRPGGYSAFPVNPVSSTGPGTGVTFNVAWTAPTVVIGTDNAPAINAARNAMVAQGFVDASGRPSANAKLLFSSGGDYLVSGPLNFTDISRLNIDGQRARIYSCAAGKPVFDGLGCANVDYTFMTITGDATFPPRWSFQYGRISNVITAPANTFDQLIIEGTFVDAGFDYNCCSEGTNIGLVRGGFSAPYSRVSDACNSSFWNVTSDFITSTMTVDRQQPFGGAIAGPVSLINKHPNGCGVWMLGGLTHNYDSSYFFCNQDVFVIIVSALVPVTTGLQARNCHIEGARRAVVFRKGPTSGYGVPLFNRFVFSDSSCDVTENLFGVTEPGIVHVRVFNSDITVGFGSTTAGYFDDESMVTHSSIITGADGGVSGRWQQNVPADMTGIALLTGADAPELFVYNLVAQTDTAINGQLSVNGRTQTAGRLSVSDGTVASINVTTYGLYINPDYPTCVTDPSPGVTALLSVTAMQWLSDMHIVTAGTGYVVGDYVTLVGGTHSLAAQLHVTGVDGSGGVTSFSGAVPGSYSVYPPVGATTTTGGHGTGLVISPLDWGVHVDGTGVTVTNAGSAYTSFPGVTFSTPVNGASAARGSAVMGQAWYADSTAAHFNVPVSLPTGSVAVTQAPGDNDTSVATTAFVQAAVGGVGPFLPLTGGTVTGLTTITGNAAATPPSIAGTMLQITGANGVAPRITVDAFGIFPSHTFRAALGTAAAPTALANGSSIGVINCYGYTGSAYVNAAAMQVIADTAGWSGTSTPTRFSWLTTAVNATTPVEAMRLNNAGNLLLGNAFSDTGYRLQVHHSALAAGSTVGNIWSELDTITGASGTGTIANALSLVNDTSTSPSTSLLNLSHGFGGPAYSGGAVALNIGFSQKAASIPGSFTYYIAANIFATATASAGGTDTSSANSRGLFYGLNITPQLNSGATNFTEITSAEIDSAVLTGASVSRRVNLKLCLQSNHAVQGVLSDAMLEFSLIRGGASPTGSKIGMLFGGVEGIFPIDNTIGVAVGHTYGAVAVAGINPQLKTCIDASHINALTAHWLSPGASIDGSGNRTIGPAKLNWSASGASLDVFGQVGGTPTITAGGVNAVNGQIVTTGNGDLYTVTAVAGAITALTVIVPATSRTTGPVGGQVIQGDGVSGATCTIPWTNAHTLSLQAGGGAIVMPGLQASTTYASDAAAATGGVAVGGLYRNGSVVQIRVA